MKYRIKVILPDTQCEHGVNMQHLKWAGRLAADIEADCMIHLGDHTDNPASSKYDKGTIHKVGKYIQRDAEAGNEGLALIAEGLDGYECKKWITLGNHDIRPDKLAAEVPELSGLIGRHLVRFEDYGWDVVDYQEPLRVSGVLYCHMFCRTTLGRISAGSARSGASSALAQLRANLQSCTAGHIPGFNYAELPTEKGIAQAIIAGSFYQHHHRYATPQGGKHWNGLLVKYMVRPGEYDFERWSIKRLKEVYGD